MMQALGVLCVAALGGLTIAAYRHPKEYRKRYLVPIVILLASMWTMAAFNIDQAGAVSLTQDVTIFPSLRDFRRASFALPGDPVEDVRRKLGTKGSQHRRS